MPTNVFICLKTINLKQYRQSLELFCCFVWLKSTKRIKLFPVVITEEKEINAF